MTLAVDGAAVAAGAEGPERRGGAGEVQTDVPERIYRGGDPAGRAAELRSPRERPPLFCFLFIALVVMKKEKKIK